MLDGVQKRRDHDVFISCRFCAQRSEIRRLLASGRKFCTSTQAETCDNVQEAGISPEVSVWSTTWMTRDCGATYSTQRLEVQSYQCSGGDGGAIKPYLLQKGQFERWKT